MRPVTPALVITSGHQGLGVTRALAARGVPVVVAHAAPRDLAAASRLPAEVVRVPVPEQGPDFVDALLDLAPRYGAAVLMPTSDEATRDVAARRGELAAVFHVACPPLDAVRRCIDKAGTYALAQELGIAIPVTHAAETAEDVARIAATIDYPCLVKPRESHRYVAQLGAKVALARTAQDLTDAWAAAAELGLGVMVQDVIPGRDVLGVNYNAFRAQGEVRAECTARKVRLSPPRFGIPRVVHSAVVPEVVEPARALLDALGLEGFANVEFKLDERDGVYRLLEVNCRHNRSTLLSVLSGVDFPYMDYRYALTGELPTPVRQRTGGYWIDETDDVLLSLTRAGRDGAGLREIVRPWRGQKVFAAYDRADLGPWAVNVRRLMEKGARGAVRPLLERVAPGFMARRRAAIGDRA